MAMRGFTHNTHYTEHTKTKVTESYRIHRMHTKNHPYAKSQNTHTTQNNRFINAEKNQPKYTEYSNSDFFLSICKKKKQRLTEKRNHTWCELGHDSSSGVKEGGTSLLDLDSGDRMHKKKQIILALNHRIHTTHNNIFINAKKKINQNTQNAQTRIC